MASTDFTALTGTSSLDSTHVLRGVTNGIARPTGGGSFLYGWNSKDTTQGVAGLYVTPQGGQTNFAPMLKGGSVRIAMKRGVSSGNINFAPFIFIAFQTNDVSANGYIMGLSDATSSHLTLKKVSSTNPLVSLGLPDTAPGSAGILMRSTATFANDTWVHVRLDAIYNTNGDVILQCFQNTSNAAGVDPANATANVTTPSWVAIPGMESFTDDSLGVNSAQGGPASPPYVGGDAGFGFWTKDSGRRAYVDAFEVYKQL